ncbi:hypothetical protein HYV21_00225 [Candidatus Microgenomates bacterium]|nr:hypothetical protein [Candidatus Microgenomates bacterium]
MTPKKLVLNPKDQGSAKLVLIDGNAILHRAYHALPPLTNRQGQIVNAVYGFCTMLFRVVQDLKPSHLAVAFDTEKPTFRHAAYVGYQAQRPRMESDLSEQIALVQDMVSTMGVPIYIAPGYEADDVIGTLAHQAKSNKQKAAPAKAKLRRCGRAISEVIVVTGDRDLFQLINKHVKVYSPMKGLSEAQVFDEKGVEDYMGIPSTKIVDYKALIGDSSDNYSGVPGIGPKTAVALLKKYGSFEGIYKHIKELEPSLVQKLSEGHESGILSRDLATIRTDAPVELDLEHAKLQPFTSNARFIKRLQELGFKSLVARLQNGTVKEQRMPKKKKARKGEQQLKLV